MFDFETLGTAAGVINAQAFDTTDRIQGAKSISFGTSGAGDGTITYAITPKNIESFHKLRFWFKIKKDFGDRVSRVDVRIGQDASNYFEYNMKSV